MTSNIKSFEQFQQTDPLMHVLSANTPRYRTEPVAKRPVTGEPANESYTESKSPVGFRVRIGPHVKYAYRKRLDDLVDCVSLYHEVLGHSS